MTGNRVGMGVASALIAMTLLSTQAQAQDQLKLEAFAWRVGDSWDYDYTINGKASSETWVVKGTREGIVTIVPSGKAFQHDYLVKLDGHLLQSSSVYTKELVTYEGYQALRFPAAPGDSWSSDATLNGENFAIKGQFTWRAIGWEKISAPAGEFNALKVEMTSEFKGKTNAGMAISGTSKDTRWYAQEVRAWVKWQMSDSLGRSFEALLTKFTPGP
jgi:hypothetical protein